MKRSLSTAALGVAALALSFASYAADQASSDQVAASFERMLSDATIVPAQPVSGSRDEDPLLQYFHAALWDSALSRCTYASNDTHAAANTTSEH